MIAETAVYRHESDIAGITEQIIAAIKQTETEGCTDSHQSRQKCELWTMDIISWLKDKATYSIYIYIVYVAP